MNTPEIRGTDEFRAGIFPRDVSFFEILVRVSISFKGGHIC